MHGRGGHDIAAARRRRYCSASALVFVLIFRKLGLGATLGYLVAGALVGPQALGLVGEAEAELGIAELGIVLLLFLVGLELSPSRLWRMRQEFSASACCRWCCAASRSSAVIYAFTGFSAAAALGAGPAARLCHRPRRCCRCCNPPGGCARLRRARLLHPAVPGSVDRSADHDHRGDVAQPGRCGRAAGLAAVRSTPSPRWSGLVLAGRFLLRPFFRLIGNLGEREMFVFAGLFTVLASAALMEVLGLSTALGAFIAGVMLADSPYRHEIEADVEPFRSILLGLFFLAVGMMLDLSAIAERPVFVVGMAAALIATKAVVIGGLALAFRMKWRQALALGLLLSQGGEFGFVLFAQAQGALSDQPGGGEPVRRDRHPLHGDDAVPDDGHRAHPRRAGDRGRTRRAGGGRIERADRRLWPVRPDRRPDAAGAGRAGDADRHRYRDDRRGRRFRGQGLLWRRHAGRHAAPGGRRRCRTDPVLHRRRPDRTRADRRRPCRLSRRGDLRPRVSTAARC